MVRLSRVLGMAVAAASAVSLLASAAAARPPVGNHQLTTTHFVVHYNTDPTAKDYTTETQAGDIGAYAEQAYSLYMSWGYAPPVDDGDGHVDIYVLDLSGPPSQRSIAFYEGAGPGPSTGYFEIAPTAQLEGFATKDNFSPEQEAQQVVAQNVFYMFEFAAWSPTTQSDYWLIEGGSSWASYSSLGFPAAVVGNPDIALNCRDDLVAHQMCVPDVYSDGGFARWAFFNLLATRYGNAFLSTALANGGSGQDATTALTNAIAAKGGSLADAFTDYSVAFMTGNFGVPALSSVRPEAFSNVLVGTKTAALAPVDVPVDHLSARYVTFQRGDGDGSHPCYAATLSITVTMPDGTSSRPYFVWDDPSSTPVALSVNGNTATTTVPWDTCAWGTKRGWLSLPNASTTVDGATFTVASSVSVDTNTPAAAASAPTGPTIWGTTVPVPTTDVAPLIDVFGPELLKLSATDPTIRLIVSSSGVGSVNATLGTRTLGSRPLRAGNNDLRFVVPKGLLTTLRRAASAGHILTLTPMSTSGAVAGQPVTRHVTIAQTPKAKKSKK
jgi:hypothetical protein